jgi:hypothetical protein
LKKRSDNTLASLAGRRWGGEPAADYLYARLDGEDGEDPWSVERAATEISKKLGRKVSPQTVSKWRKAEAASRRSRENFELAQRATLEFFAEHADKVDLDRMVEAQLVFMIGRIHAEDGAEEAVAALKAYTALKRATTEERRMKQQIREYEESTERLRATIDRLTSELKSRGYDPAALDALNQRVVGEVDAMILANRKGK